MNRSIWKLPRVLLSHGSANIRVTYLRAATISPLIVGKVIHVHNGHRFIPVHVTENHVGFKLGQFVHTKKRVMHKKKKSNK